MRFALFALLASSAALFADEPKPVAKADPKSDLERLNGVWVFDGYNMPGGSGIGQVWNSVVTVADGKFNITKLYGSKTPFAGTLSVDEAKKAIDFKLDGFDLSSEGMPLKLSPTTVPALYKLDGDTLTLALELSSDGKRPTDFTLTKKRDALLVLKRVPKDFKALPTEFTVKVLGPDDKPAGGVVVGGFMDLMKELNLTDAKGEKFTINPLKTTPDELKAVLARLPDDKELRTFVTDSVTPPPGTIRDPDTGWTMHYATTAAADGTTKFKTSLEDLRTGTVIARDPAKKLMGVVGLSPWKLLVGEVTVKLQPECRVTVTGTCNDIAKSGVKVEDQFGSYAMTANGQRITYYGDKGGKLEYLLPPGEYKLFVYGSEAMGDKAVSLNVPKDQSEYAAPPVDIPATGMHKLFGNQAPELTDVVGWKGEPVKLADLKGKVVLLEFWGYWCGPCIASMPVLYELHDKFKDDGLVIIGIHVDGDGEVDTAKALDEKIKNYKKEVWKDRDLPFPSALVAGKAQEAGGRGKLAGSVYGIRSYPTTILIDRDGKVVGKFNAREAQSAIAEMEKILKAGKK